MAATSSRRHDTPRTRHDGAHRQEDGQELRRTHTSKQWRRDSPETTIQSSDNDIWLASPLSLPTPPNAAYAPADTSRHTSLAVNSDTPIPTPTAALIKSSKVTPDGSQPPSRTPSRSSIKSATADLALAKLDQQPTSPTSTTTNLVLAPLKPLYPPPARKPTPPGLPSYDLAQEIARETRARGGRHTNRQWPPPGGQAQPHPLLNGVPLPQVWNPPRSAHDVMRHHPYLRVANTLPVVRTAAGLVRPTTGSADRAPSIMVGRSVGEVVMIPGTGNSVAECDDEGWRFGYRSWVMASGCCCLWHLGSEDSSDEDWIDRNLEDSR